MTKNMGAIDRIIRIIIATTIAIMYIYDMISGTAAIVLGILSLVFFVTSFIGFCPLYTVLKIKTNGEE